VADEDQQASGADTITIVLADDHEIVRDGLRMLLEAEPDMEVVSEASDVETAARKVRGHHPTILVLDLNMAGESSLGAIPQIVEESPDTEIVVLTMENSPAFAREALGAGTRGFVLKQSAGQELVTAIREVAGGRTYINPQLGARIAAEPPSQGLPDGLTAREAEVLGLIAVGNTNPEIAKQLFLSVRTVETHRSNLQRKTGLTTRAELVGYAIENDLVARGEKSQP
jgi:two-component system response regulator NreC